jgi:two-component system chemotaxis response regulator CheB
MNKIKVLIIDDSPLFRKFLSEGLSKFKYIDVVGTATDPLDAETKLQQITPDVICCDIDMPHMDGITFVKKLMRVNPVRVIMVSTLNVNVVDAISAGAVDFVRKPSRSEKGTADLFLEELVDRIIIASRTTMRMVPDTLHNDMSVSQKPNNVPRSMRTKRKRPTLIAIGASTGGTEAVLDIMTQMPANTPGVLIVQHMPAGFTKMYAERLNKICQMEVREAKTGDRVEEGLALIAPGDFHMMLIEKNGEFTVRCVPGDKVSGHRPSVDVLFASVAQAACPNAVGVILTGMGGDGAKGLLEMKKAGAYTIGQDEESCVVYGMPMVAYNMGAVTQQAPLENIPGLILSHLAKM